MMKYYIWLNNAKGLTTKDKRALITHFGNPKMVYQASKLDLPEEYLSVESLWDEAKKKDLIICQRILEENDQKGIRTITIDAKEYPDNAKTMSNPPLILYYKGCIGSQHNLTVTIVGTRKATEYGIAVAKLATGDYIARKSVIISGLAIGIDSVAHKTAILMGGFTYAFVANGLDVCYPKENSRLMDEIKNQGAVISPYPVGTPPRKHQFIRRNEIMSGWSDEVVVVEGGARSGAVMTGQFALKNHRPVYAVPNNIFISTSDGCNILLDKGARPYLCKHDLTRKKPKLPWLSESTTSIIEILKTMPLSSDDLSGKLDNGLETLQKELYLLELNNQIRLQPDGKWHYIGW